jgi:ABC-type maltose transport system permease subunit
MVHLSEAAARIGSGSVPRQTPEPRRASPGATAAAGMLVIVPVVAVFIYIQCFLVAGWGAGAIKG